MIVVEFQHAFPSPDGLLDYDITAAVDLDERIVQSIDAVLTGSGQPARLTPQQRAFIEERALNVADDLWGTP